MTCEETYTKIATAEKNTRRMARPATHLFSALCERLESTLAVAVPSSCSLGSKACSGSNFSVAFCNVSGTWFVFDPMEPAGGGSRSSELPLLVFTTIFTSGT